MSERFHDAAAGRASTDAGIDTVNGLVASVNTSRGGIPKAPVFEARLTRCGLEGDHQNDATYHGGPDRAVVLFSLDVIRSLQGLGHPITVGAIGENLTISGLDWPAIAPGAILQIGEATVQVTKYATPCRKIRDAFLGGDYMRVFQNEHPGWSRVCARVTTEGVVRPGDEVRLVPNPPGAQ